MEIENPYNPAVLSVCRESRAIALKHCRLCFGTTNVYADLSLDVLYFGHHWYDNIGEPGNNLLKWCKWSVGSGRELEHELEINIKADLEQIAHVAILSKHWLPDFFARRTAPYTGVQAQAGIKLFSNLKQFSIVTRQRYDWFYGTPYYYEFTADTNQCWESRIEKEFLTMDLTDEEKKHGVRTLLL